MWDARFWTPDNIFINTAPTVIDHDLKADVRVQEEVGRT